jgi:hypothetical protein
MSYQVIDGINSTDVHSESFLAAMVGSVADALKVPASAVKVSIAHERRNKRALLSSASATLIISVTSGMTSRTVLEMLREAMRKEPFLTSMQVKSGLPIISMSATTLSDTTPSAQAITDPNASYSSKKGGSL